MYLRDLDIRGAGNLLGGEQSGFITDIGYETYQRILEDTIQELKEKVEGLPECLADVQALVPQLTKMVEDVKRFDIQAAVADAKEVLQTLNQAANDCRL